MFKKIQCASPLFLMGALFSLSIPIAAIAAQVLSPPVTATGLLSTPILTAINNGTGTAVTALSKGTASYSKGNGDGAKGETINPSATTHAHAAGLSGYDKTTDGGTLNFGVYGSSVHGVGINGLSVYGSGVRAESTTSYGVMGFSDSTRLAAGVFGRGFTGVEGYGTEFPDGRIGVGVSAVGGMPFAQCGSVHCPASLMVADYEPKHTGVNLIAAFDNSGNQLMRLDDSGNLYLAGKLFTVTTNASCTTCVATRTSTGQGMTAYTSRSVLPTIEMIGKGRIRNGQGYVDIDGKFAASIDKHSPYAVFITPDADNRGLYVANRSTNGFTVRESQGGRSTLTFDYRIVAKTYDAAPR